MLSEIKFKSDKYSNYKFPDSEQNDEFKNLNKVNLLIGPNNSGKSRFLRTLFSDDEYDYRLLKYDIIKIKTSIEENHNKIKVLFVGASLEDAENINSEILDIKNNLSYFTKGDIKKPIIKLRDFANKLSSLNKFSSFSRKPNIISTRNPDYIIPKLNGIGNDLKTLIVEIFPPDFDYIIQKVYIPILRGLRPINISPSSKDVFTDDDNYKVRTIKDYFEGNKTIKEQIFTGLDLYNDAKKMLLGKR